MHPDPTLRLELVKYLEGIGAECDLPFSLANGLTISKVLPRNGHQQRYGHAGIVATACDRSVGERKRSPLANGLGRQVPVDGCNADSK